MPTRKIKVVGAGGIGGYLLDPLCRYLSYVGDDIELTVFDGDKYEEKNKDRQKFCANENKSVHTVSRLKIDFPRIHFKSKSDYLVPDNIIPSIREGDVVFLCVDNHATRKLVSDRCQELDNVVLISGGNDYTDGNVIVYLRKDGKDVTKPLTALHSKIANPKDKNPGIVDVDKISCEERAISEPQLLFTNLAIASCMCSCYYAYEKNKITFEQVYVDILTQRMRPAPDPEFI